MLITNTLPIILKGNLLIFFSANHPRLFFLQLTILSDCRIYTVAYSTVTHEAVIEIHIKYIDQTPRT